MTDSAPHTVRSVVINPAFDWEGDRPPQIAYPDSVIYEAHVRSLTRAHPEIPPELQGTYAVAHPVMIDYLQRLGVTAVELMPVHQFVREHKLVTMGCLTTGATTPSATSHRITAMPLPPTATGR